MLRSPGCSALSSDENGLTPLMWAAYNGHEACVRILLPTSDALAEDVFNMTALMWAARKGHKSCLVLLLPVSDAVSIDSDGLTAGAWASKMGYESLRQFIDGHTLAQSENSAIGEAVCVRAKSRSAVPRV